ncbi:MAG: potassium channel family protein [Desulfobacterales bacterium]|nr:potassium channel family protein [Desulfobacterales bacterium]
MDPIKFKLRIYIIVFFVTMTIGTLGFMIVEDLSPADAIYFSIVTIATVGYGDIHPSTQTGKTLAILIIIIGVGTFLGVVANATEIMLNKREKQTILKKLNMIIGVFFSEVGTKLLIIFSDLDLEINNIREYLIVKNNWNKKDFMEVGKLLKNHKYDIEVKRVDFDELHSFLLKKRIFLLGLLENPILHENEYFTEVLRAVFHLTEELDWRKDFSILPDTDKAHLKGDIIRAYKLLADQWLDYMRYLNGNYPYLFSLAMRTNPFNKDIDPVVT